MANRLSAAEKGKQIQHSSPPRRGRVQVPDFDSSELMRRHELTLIGRVTNPKYQRIWSLIPFFADHWKCATRPEGADLGQGKFQFLFSSQQDIQQVLDNRPYHFAHWMVIIEKWEPTISPSFPSKIPFWIQVQDVPVHLWNEAILRSIGEDLGSFESWEITPTKARFRTQINGLLPLLFKYTLDFSNGDELQATLVYEKLEKYCTSCFNLDHAKEDCPHNPLPTIPPPSLRNNQPPQRQRELHRDHRDRAAPYANPTRETNHRPYGRSNPPAGDLRRTLRNNQAHYRERSSQSQLHPQFSSSRHNTNLRSSTPQWVESGRRLPPPPPGSSRFHEANSELRERVRDSSYTSPPKGSDQRPPVSGRGRSPTPIPVSQRISPEDLLKAQDELRDFMNQYINCVEPNERAARKERFRRSEENGEFEQTAINMAITNLAARESVNPTSPVIRSPALERLQSPIHPVLTPPLRSEAFSSRSAWTPTHNGGSSSSS